MYTHGVGDGVTGSSVGGNVLTNSSVGGNVLTNSIGEGLGGSVLQISM